MKRKHKYKHKRRFTPVFVFTPTSLATTQEAMKIYELALLQSKNQSSKIVFAKEIMQVVNGKLDTMSRSVGALCLTTFDYNEKLVIATAIRLYTLELLAAPVTVQQERKLKECKQIERFALSNLKIELPGTTQD